MKKNVIALVILLAAFLLVVLLMGDKSEAPSETSVLDEYNLTQRITTDTVLVDSMTVPSGEAIVMVEDSVLTSNQDLIINGAIGCSDGSLTIRTNGKLTLNDTLACEDGESGDITIIATGGLEMSPEARIVATGNVQIVDSEDSVKNTEELEALYDEVDKVPDSGIFVGPFVADETVSPVGDDAITVFKPDSKWSLIPIAYAQVDNGTTTVNLTGEPIKVSGKIKVETPSWDWVKRIVVFDFPNTREVIIQDFELEGPEGRAGESDTGSCDVTGEPGEDAFRFNAYAPNLVVNNFTLVLGAGGEGGEATTGGECEEAKAKGGKGGKPGNFRMIGSQKFEIQGAFLVHPGNGGAGGGASAIGKIGKPGEKGGDADATGGDGSDNKKKLTVGGTVAGTGNVQFGDAVGGSGGYGYSEGGAGGAAEKCGETGGPGGKATAESGKGGDAKLTVSGGAVRMDFANDIGGQGGIVEAYGGVGGAGGSCDETAKGGDGGKGGDANAKEGKGGLGKNGRAADGAEFGDLGGNGGVGGDGCTEGIGGEGGTGGSDDGEKGEDGRNVCLSITKEEDYISLLPGEIQVIQYMDYYIPIENLEKVDGHEGSCEDEHWHAGAGAAVNTMGYPTPDPDPGGCGFGKTAEVPVQIIQDPNYTEPNNKPDQSDGQMIRIDPPPFIIPAN